MDYLDPDTILQSQIIREGIIRSTINVQDVVSIKRMHIVRNTESINIEQIGFLMNNGR